MTLNHYLKNFSIAISVLSGLLSAETKVAGTLSSDAVWNRQGSPYIVLDDLTVTDGAALVIEAGTEIRFKKNVSLIVKGELFAGGEEGSEIVFRPDNPEEPWGGIRLMDLSSAYSDFLDSEAATKKSKGEAVKFGGKPRNYNSNLEYTEGSALVYCVFEGAGIHKRPPLEPQSKVSGAVVCYNSSPYIENCTFQNNSFTKGGAVSVLYYSAPLIRNCKFYNNQTDQGGAAVYCFFFSEPVIIGNLIRNNSSRESGGAVLVNSSKPLIKDNVFFKNTSKDHGGALAVFASETEIVNNQLKDNSAANLGNGIYFAASQAKVNGNLMLNGGDYDLAVGSGDSAITTQNCYWGQPLTDYAETRILDIKDNPVNGLLNLLSAASFPSARLPYAPRNIKNFKLKYDRKFETDLTINLSQDFPMYIQAEAAGGSPYYKDLITVNITSSSSDNKGLHIQLIETDTATNIYRGEAVVKASTNHEINHIAGQPGETITLTVDQNPDLVLSFVVQEKIPYVTACKITEEKNQQRIVNHRLNFKWVYEDLRKKPQLAFQLQIGTDKEWSNSEIYDSKEVNTENDFYQPGSLSLSDGQEYFYRIRVYNGDRWSGWLESSFAMNSIADAPLAVLPKNNIILNSDKIDMQVSPVTDPDGDTLKFVYEISADAAFGYTLEQSEFLSENSWKNNKPLKDNGHFFWRSRVFDGYEYSNYMISGDFWINTLEENPEEPLLSDPQNKTTVYTTNPDFVWQETADPDPQSIITYILTYGTDRNLGSAVTKKDLKSTTFACTEELKHATEYFWRITAVDQTGRKTSSQVNSFMVDTKPSVPAMAVSSEELKLGEEVTWSASTDPQVGDLLYYTLQISKSRDFKTILLTQDKIKETAIAINRLTDQKLLADDETYFCRVKATDNHNVASAYSEAAQFIFNRENNRPEIIAGGFSPKNDEVVNSSAPEVKFDPAQDKDHSDVTAVMSYEAQFCKDGKFGADSKIFSGLKGFNSVRAENLDDDDKWFWRVRAIDDDGAKSEWSKSNSFIINVMEDFPTTFALLSPEKEGLFYELNTINFRWESSKDKDYNSSIDYSFHLAKNSDFSDQKTIGSLKTTAYTLNDNLENTKTYYWKVKAKDNNGNITESPVYNFTVNSTPSVPELNPLDGKERTPADQITWQRSKDPDPRDQLTYIVQISESEYFDKNTITSSRISMPTAAGGEILKNIDKNNRLVDNTIYYWHVQAVDNRGLMSEFSAKDRFFFNRTNDAPQLISSELAPVEGAVLNDDKVTIKWLAKDPDFSDNEKVLKAQVQIDENHFKTAVPSFDLNINPGLFSLTKKLDDNKIYSYRVKVYDDENKGSEWSKPARFTVNIKEDAPQHFNLLEPLYGKYYELKMNFKWEATSDKDPLATITYRFELATDDQFINVVERELVSTTSISTKKSLSNATTYFWRVTAVDNTGLETVCQKVFSFIINSTPTVPELANKKEEEINPETGKFQWSVSTDPNPKDQLAYELEISPDEQFSSIPAAKKDLKTTSQIAAGWRDLEKLPDNQYYFARVRAKDQNYFASAWSKTIKFILNRVNDSPDQPVITSPRNNETLTSDQLNLGWQLLNDVDVNDLPETLKPEIQISRSKEFEDKSIKLKINAPSGKNSYKSEKLPDNSRYFIRMRAVDRKAKAGKWSEAVAVTINTAEDAPTDFKVTSPKGKLVNPKSINFNWEKSTDPDPESEIRYTLLISTDKSFGAESTRSFADLKQAVYFLNEQLSAGTYFWKVAAIDNTGRKTMSRNVENFTVTKK